MTGDTQTAAFAYLELGWSVLPLCPPKHLGVGRLHAKSCSSPGKCPFFPDTGRSCWDQFKAERPTRAQLARWYGMHPGLNVGVALGPVSGLAAVDVDSEEGEVLLQEMSGGDLPPTWEYATGKGRRLLYSLPAERVIRTHVFKRPGTKEEILQLMSAGRQVVLPPSVHPTGRVYAWRAGRGVEDCPPAPVPAWWPEKVAPRAACAEEGAIGEGGRNNYLCRLAGAMRRVGADEEAIREALVSTNSRRCDPPLSDEEVAAVARSVARYEPNEIPARDRVGDLEEFVAGLALRVKDLEEFVARRGR